MGFRLAYRSQSVLMIFWVYGAYMSFLGLMKFDLDMIPINMLNADSAFSHEMYLLISNALFLATSRIIWHIRPSKKFRYKETLFNNTRSPLYIYIAVYFIGVALYFQAAQRLDYTAFVNYDGSAWAQVAFYSGATLISILSARRNWLLALALCSPYVLLSSTLGIRAFIALSLFPVLILLVSSRQDQGHLTGHLPKRIGSTFKLSPNTILGFAVACGALIYAINGASLTKHGEVTLPEEKLIESYIIVTNALEGEHVPLGTESIERFFWGIGSPVFKQLGIRYERESDPPAIFATYIDEYALRLGLYFHYPALWQADTFAAFRYAGLLLAPFWAIVLISLERLLRSNSDLWVMFLPVSCWVAFMFARGSLGNATIGVSYVILLQIGIYLLLSLLNRKRSNRETFGAKSSAKQGSR